MTPQGMRLAHGMLDLVTAVDVGQELEPQDRPRAMTAAVQRLVNAGLFEVVVHDQRAGFGVEMQPFVEAITFPLLTLLEQLADFRNQDVADVLADLRSSLDTLEHGGAEA